MRKEKNMKINKISQRLQKKRPMTMVSIRIPNDVIDDLKRVAPMLGFSGYQALIKAYVGQGLRTDLERLESSVEISALLKSLRKKGVKEAIISSAMAEVQSSISHLWQKRQPTKPVPGAGGVYARSFFQLDIH